MSTTQLNPNPSTLAPRNAQDLNWLDYTAAVLMLTFITIEGVADNQQFAFQTEKYRRKDAGEPLKGDMADGFNQSGLYAVVRKPNYASEQVRILMLIIDRLIKSLRPPYLPTNNSKPTQPPIQTTAPNYYSPKQSIWVCFYFFSVAATGSILNWSVLGCLLLIMLFQGSGWMTELITLKKYPKYAVYMKRVGQYLPLKFLWNKVRGEKRD